MIKRYYIPNNSGSVITIDRRNYQVNHGYDVPYERNDLYIKMGIERDARNPETKMFPEQGKTLYADIDYEYNYFIDEYEEFSRDAASGNGNFYVFPCLNNFLLKQNDAFPNITDYNKLMTAMNTVYPDSTALKRTEKLLSREYFSYYSRAAGAMLRDEKAMERYLAVRKRYTTEYISHTSLQIYKDLENKREMFPFFAKISMEGLISSQLSSLFEEAELDKTFIDFFISHGTRNVNKLVYREANTNEAIPEHEAACCTLSQFYDFIEQGEEAFSYSTPDKSKSYCDYLESFVRIKILKSKIQHLMSEENVGTSHTMGYKIVKYIYDKHDPDAKDKQKQISYFFNFEDIKDFKFYDTAVSYAEPYRYEIFIINAIIASPSTAAGEMDGAEIVFMHEPYYSETIYIVDSPPIAPDIELITYRGIDNKVLILFNSMVDKAAETPIYIRSTDQETMKKQYLAQNIEAPNPIIYESDDPTNFEIFKTLKKPLKYSDFNNNYYKFIDSDMLTSAAYVDDILPNTKYYYIFRAKDIHGYISNPTPIYEFEIIKDGETMYPRIRIVEFKEADPPVQKTKSFKKYLKIGFSPSQYQIPENDIASIDTSLHNRDVNIGISGDNIIGTDRKFKFRIRSKNTGKLIDLNVAFKKNKAIKV